MTSTTLFSNKTSFSALCRTLIKRNIGAMVYLTVLGFVFFPLQYILTTFAERFDRGAEYVVFPDVFAHTIDGHTPVSLVFFTMIMLITPIVIGLSQLSYLQSKRAVDVYHSLPVTRDSLMAANFCVGFVTIMLPALLNYAATAVAGAVKAASTPYSFTILPLLSDLGVWSIIVLVILSAMTFVSVQVGSVFDNFVFGMELILAPAAVALMTLGILDQFLLGFSMNNIRMEDMTLYSPISLIIARYALHDNFRNYLSQEHEILMRNNNIGLIIWFGLALVFFAAALMLYRRRKSEMAEKVSSASPIAQAGKLTAVYLGGLLIGLTFYHILSSEREISFAGWSILGAALVYVLVEVILLRGFRGLSKSLLPGAVSVVLVGLFAFAAIGGGFGYANKIPGIHDVESISIDYRGRYEDISQIDGSSKTLNTQTYWENGRAVSSSYYRYDHINDVTLTSKEAIQIVMDYHKAIIDYNKNKEYESYDYSNQTITYQLKGGKKMVRTYSGEDIPESAKIILAELEGTEEFKRQTHPVFNSTSDDYSRMNIINSLGMDSSPAITDPGQMDQMLQALAADMLEEDIGRVIKGSGKFRGYVQFQLKGDPSKDGTDRDLFLDCYVLITEDYRRTIALIEGMGMGDFISGSMEKITEAGISRDYYTGGRYSAISVISFPEHMRYGDEARQKFGELDYRTDDAQLVKKLADLAYIQAYHDNDEAIATVIFYDETGRQSIPQFVKLNQLPKEVVDQLPQWYHSELREKVVIQANG